MKINIAPGVYVHDAALNTVETINSDEVRILCKEESSRFVKAKNRIRTPMCTFFVGRYFLRHQIVPRPIYKVAGTVPAHFDQGFSPKLQKLTFCPSKDVCIGPVC